MKKELSEIGLYPMQQDEYDNLKEAIANFMRDGYYDGLGELQDQVARLEEIGKRQLKEQKERQEREQKEKEEREKEKERKAKEQKEKREKEQKEKERKEKEKKEKEQKEKEQKEKEEKEKEQREKEEKEREEKEKAQREKQEKIQKKIDRKKRILGYTKNIGKGAIKTIGKGTKFTGKLGLKTLLKATELSFRGGIKTVNALASNEGIQKILTGAGMVTASVMIQPVGVAMISAIGIHRMIDAVSNNEKGLIDDINDIFKVGNNVTKGIIDKVISPTLDKLDNKTKELGSKSQKKINDVFSR